MTETEKSITDLNIKMTELEQRGKSHSHQIDELKGTVQEVKDSVQEVKNRTDAIYEMNKNIALMAQNLTSVKDDMGEMKTDINNVKTDVKSMNDRINEVESEPAKNSLKLFNKIRDKAIWLIVGGILAFILYSILPSVPWK